MKRTRITLTLALALVLVFTLMSPAMAARPQPQLTSAYATGTGGGVNQYRLTGTFTGRPYAWNYVIHYPSSTSSWYENRPLSRDELRVGTISPTMFTFTNTPVSIDLVIFDRKGNLLDTYPCTMQ